MPQPVMSLQTGTELAQTSEVIIDPRQLVIVALYVTGSLLDTEPAVLHTSDIRELGGMGCIVNDSSALMELEGLVRLEEIVNFKFDIFGMPVIDEHGKHLGKVDTITFEATTYTVQQIQTRRSLLSSLSHASHVINRSQIISVTNESIIVRSPSITESVGKAVQHSATMINPFKNPQTEHHKDR